MRFIFLTWTGSNYVIYEKINYTLGNLCLEQPKNGKLHVIYLFVTEGAQILSDLIDQPNCVYIDILWNSLDYIHKKFKFKLIVAEKKLMQIFVKIA